MGILSAYILEKKYTIDVVTYKFLHEVKIFFQKFEMCRLILRERMEKWTHNMNLDTKISIQIYPCIQIEE